MNKTSRLQYLFDLVFVLTQKEMKVRYKSSLFGYIWSIAQPLAFAFVFFVAFKVVMRIQMEDYSLFLIAGLFPWQWFANSVNGSPMVFLANASIIKKVNFPRDVILLASVLQDMIHFALSIPVLVFFMLLFSKVPSLSWLYGIPVLLAIQFMMVYGLALVIASFNLFFRDLERLVTIFTTFIFYFTPIIYPVSMIPDKYKPLINFNPLAPLITNWRSLFLDGAMDLTSVAISFGYGSLTFVVGYLVYKKFSWKFAEVL